ncbi:MAG: hypothetical protein GY833_12700 [Aestuariibacter sp.]|nr:hypothetical protein [Aestuariibacter sp.]|tara:strand:+ start:125858 stop:126091 length:234 start_codon:yes stop_codon:yes gene_type:complete
MATKNKQTLKEFERDYLPTPCHCGATMTAEEAFYYEQCESCTEEKWHRLRSWMAGAEDKELDERFSAPPSKDNKVMH